MKYIREVGCRLRWVIGVECVAKNGKKHAYLVSTQLLSLICDAICFFVSDFNSFNGVLRSYEHDTLDSNQDR